MEKQVVRLYLGTQEEHTVFEAELAGAPMGAKLMQLKRGVAFMIGLDSQVAIQTMRRETMILGQYLINALHRQMEGLYSSQPAKLAKM